MRSAALAICAISFSVALTAIACATSYGEADAPDAASDTTAEAVDSGAGSPGEGDAADARDAAVGCNGQIDCERVVFLSSEIFAASALQSLERADAICNGLAASSTSSARVSGRTFVAWLSTSTVSAVDRLVFGRAPYVLPNGMQLATDWIDLTSSTHLAPIDVTESGAILDEDTQDGVWTGTEASGSSADLTCDDWTSSDGNGVFGDFLLLDNYWSSDGSMPCTQPLHIYCIER